VAQWQWTFDCLWVRYAEDRRMRSTSALPYAEIAVEPTHLAKRIPRPSTEHSVMR
jgi:hypothetical protein